jgi:hypothetical protein
MFYLIEEMRGSQGLKKQWSVVGGQWSVVSKRPLAIDNLHSQSAFTISVLRHQTATTIAFSVHCSLSSVLRSLLACRGRCRRQRLPLAAGSLRLS